MLRNNDMRNPTSIPSESFDLKQYVRESHPQWWKNLPMIFRRMLFSRNFTPEHIQQKGPALIFLWISSYTFTNGY